MFTEKIFSDVKLKFVPWENHTKVKHNSDIVPVRPSVYLFVISNARVSFGSIRRYSFNLVSAFVMILISCLSAYCRLTYIVTYLLTYLLTFSVKQSPS
jgi:hypothetical protein